MGRKRVESIPAGAEGGCVCLSVYFVLQGRFVRVCVCVCGVCVCVRVCVCMRARAPVHTHTFVCVCVCVCAFMHGYVDVQVHRLLLYSCKKTALVLR